jgi:hypothetical protein
MQQELQQQQQQQQQLSRHIPSQPLPVLLYIQFLLMLHKIQNRILQSAGADITELWLKVSN